MALVVTNVRDFYHACDALSVTVPLYGTDTWVGSKALAVFTAEPEPIQPTGCIGINVSNSTEYAYTTSFTTGVGNSSALYVWIYHRAELDTLANGGIQIVAANADGSSVIGFHVGGSDVDGFRHSQGPVTWQCVVFDHSRRADYPRTEHVGTYAGLNSSPVAWGVAFKTLVKSVGNIENCFWDVMRSQAPLAAAPIRSPSSLRVTAGTIDDPGTFAEIAAEDRLKTAGKAIGCLRETGAGLFGAQGRMEFGDTAGTTATYFKDTNVVVVFEDRMLAVDKYGIVVQGNATGSTTFQLGEPSGSGDDLSGTDGCSIITPAGVGANFTATDADLQELFLYGSTFTGFTEGMAFSNDATRGPNHQIAGCTFSGCGIITPGRAFVRNCRISGAVLPTISIQFRDTAPYGALAWNGIFVIATTNPPDIARCQFTMGASGHGIKIRVPGVYDFDDLTFSGYGGTPGSNLVPSSGSTDAAVYNDSGGAVTINNINGGNSPSVRNGAGATTTVVDGAVTVKATITLVDGTPLQNANVLIKATSGGPLPFEVVVTIANSGTTATVTHTAHGLQTWDKIRIKGASHAANNGVFSITFISANSYSYTMGSTPGSNPTGTILATFVVLSGLTNVNGQISASRVYPSDQPVIGWARKSSSAPYYKESVLAGTVDSIDGLQVVALMIPD